MVISADSNETVSVDTATVDCDGGGGALGHPKVYLNLDPGGAADCPYCGRHFVLADGAGGAGGSGH